LVQGQEEASLVALEGAAYGPDGSQRDAAIDSLTERLEELKSAADTGANTPPSARPTAHSPFTLPENNLQSDPTPSRLQ